MSTKKKPDVSEDVLLKALDELEEAAGTVKKGKIPSEMKNPNGGLATEGTSDLEASASEAKKADKTEKPSLIKGKKKAMPVASEESSSDGSEEESSDESGSEDDSMSKAESSESSSSSSEMSKSGKKMKKSLRENLEDKPEIKKAIEVSDFMEGLVDGVSDALGSIQKSMQERDEGQQEFNQRLTKAMVVLGKQNVQQAELIKSLIERLEETPSGTRKTKAVLSKADVVERKVGGTDGEELQVDHSNPQHRARVSAILLQKAMKGEIPNTVVTMYESGLPVPQDLIKSIENDLIKASNG